MDLHEFVRRYVQCGMRKSNVGTIWVREERRVWESRVSVGAGEEVIWVEDEWSLCGERRSWREIGVTYLGLRCAGSWLLGERKGSFGWGSH